MNLAPVFIGITSALRDACKQNEKELRCPNCVKPVVSPAWMIAVTHDAASDRAEAHNLLALTSREDITGDPR